MQNLEKLSQADLFPFAFLLWACSWDPENDPTPKARRERVENPSTGSRDPIEHTNFAIIFIPAQIAKNSWLL
jgi:hypothetical protein